MAAKIDKLVIQQKLSAEQLLKYQTDFHADATSKLPKSVMYLKRLITKVQSVYENFNKTHKRILDLISEDQDLEIPYFQEDHNHNFESLHLNFQSELEDLLQTLTSEQFAAQSQQGSSEKAHDEFDLKLPRINLPKFDGSYETWVSFRDLFQSLIHNRATTSKVEKLHYLKCSLTGEAEKLLHQFAITEANYDAAWRLLNERYDNKYALLNANYKRLLQLSNAHESSTSLKALLDRTTECVQSIHNLNVSNLWDSMIVHMTAQRLPQETRQLWEQQQASNLKLPTFETLKTFLENRFRALEASGIERPKPSKITTTNRVAHVSQNNVPACSVCKGGHSINQCRQFTNASPEQRYDLAKRNLLCINCLRKGHSLSTCPSKSTCRRCAKRHHTLLHRNGASYAEADPALPSSSSGVRHFGWNGASYADADPALPSSSSGVRHIGMNATNIDRSSEVLLATALVTLEGANGTIVMRALLDQGSQASLISESAAQQLGLKRSSTTLTINGVGNSRNAKVKAAISVNLITHANERIAFEALVLQKLTGLVPTRRINTSKWTQLENLHLADPYFDRPGQIDLLLGADVYAQIILHGLRNLSLGAIAQHTKIGWIISGTSDATSSASSYNCFNIELNRDAELNDELRKFWELEEVVTTQSLTPEEEQCELHFLENVKRNPQGRYTVKLPFKSDDARDSLGNSRSTALASFLSLERRLERNPELKREYHNCIREYADLGHMRLAESTSEHIVEDGERRCVAYYLPHHAVFKDSSTTKCRVVFNASRKTTSGVSLNDVLLTGPALLTCIFEVLMRWRLPKYAIIADVARMYRNIDIDQHDAQFQRFIWRFDPKEAIQDCCLTTVTFGFTCAAYLAIRVLNKLAEDEKQRFPVAHQAVTEEFYVDDWLSGGNELYETIAKRKETHTLLASGGFQLRKWIANDPRLLEGIPDEDIEMKPTIDLDLEEGYKSLGMIWHPAADQFSYKIKLELHKNSYSKRQMLSEIARLYDPMGWLAPIVIVAKILMQSLWLHGSSWDDPLPAEIHHSWIKLRHSLEYIEELRIPRWTHTQPNSKLELHGFSDASIKAYAAVVYLVVRNEKGTYSNLIMAKTKVAPIKTVSIPRLELCGAVLLAKLMERVKKALNHPDIKTWLWTDSSVTLSWLKGHPNRWTTFVANRTTEILQTTGNTPWLHVPSKHNPADLASRGIESSELIHNTLWWNGPSWLCEAPSKWPEKYDVTPTQMEQRKNLLIHVNFKSNSELDELLAKFSTMTRLIRVTAYCYRFLNLVTQRTQYRGHLTTTELKRSSEFWIKYTQQTYFGSDISSLINNQSTSKQSHLITLHPFVDGDGFLRVRGRLTNSTLPYGEKHPLILPKNGRFVELLLNHIHKSTLHGQIQLMLSTLRKQYWILRARDAVKRVIRQCIVCFRVTAKVSKQLMGSYPTPRVVISRPFTHTGVDFCGPFELKDRRGRGSKTYKGYVAIFICLAVKAVHLEVVSDLTTSSFLAALRRFMGRRGLCSEIYSDCGTNFIGADAELNRIVKSASNEAAELLANEGIEWHFIPPASPHFGGLWEAGVKSVKQHLNRVLRNNVLTYEEMATVLIQIEACLNSRPLCPLSDEFEDTSALTPAHFLVGSTLLALPDVDLTDLNINRLDRWQYIQRLTQMFWKRWKAEYLTRLQQRPKWLTVESVPKVGDLCLLKDDRLASYRWPLARITELHPGNDGLARVVTLRLGTRLCKRPITKIALLPTQEHENQLSNIVLN